MVSEVPHFLSPCSRRTHVLSERAMNTDADVYGDDYDSFRPERFLDETGKKENVPPNTHGEVRIYLTPTCITTC